MLYLLLFLLVWLLTAIVSLTKRLRQYEKEKQAMLQRLDEDNRHSQDIEQQCSELTFTDKLIKVPGVQVAALTRRSEAEERPRTQAYYEFGVDLGERVGEDEYISTLQKAIKLYHDGFISKLKADMEATLCICEHNIREITPGGEFSVKSFESHVRAAARIAAYYAVVQVYLRHPGVNTEKITAKLGKDFHDSLMHVVGCALSIKYVQKFVAAWKVLEWIEETATGIEEKVGKKTNSKSET